MSAKQKIVSAKNKIVRNRTKILGTIAVISTTGMVVMRLGLKQHDDFLKEKKLYEEFYTLDEE
jgi:hypothetical protein